MVEQKESQGQGAAETKHDGLTVVPVPLPRCVCVWGGEEVRKGKWMGRKVFLTFHCSSLLLAIDNKSH